MNANIERSLVGSTLTALNMLTASLLALERSRITGTPIHQLDIESIIDHMGTKLPGMGYHRYDTVDKMFIAVLLWRRLIYYLSVVSMMPVHVVDTSAFRRAEAAGKS